MARDELHVDVHQTDDINTVTIHITPAVEVTVVEDEDASFEG